MNGPALIFGLVLLLLNGFFVAAEFALIAARRTKLEEMAEQGGRRATAAMKSVKELSFMLAGCQLGITMASLGLGFVAEPAVAHLLENAIDNFVELPSGLLHTISFIVALTIVVFLHMVIGEMAPKNWAIAAPEKASLRIALPIRFYAAVFRPVIHALNWIANHLTRLLGVEVTEERISVHTVEEIGAIIAESARGGMIDRFEERLLSGAVELGERDAEALLVPRTEMVALPYTTSPAEIERTVVDTGTSRIPIYRDDLDNIVGFFHAKDLLKVGASDRERPVSPRLIRQMLVVPESRRLRPLLLDMRRGRHHVALVIDEHGGTAGIVTLEDLIEELVGEIRDEHDVSELGVEKVGEGRFLVPGGLRIDEAGSLGVELPEGEYETVAGFMMDRLGRIPKRRDVVEHEGWRLKVLSMHRRRVIQILIEATEPAKGAGPNDQAV